MSLLQIFLLLFTLWNCISLKFFICRRLDKMVFLMFPYNLVFYTMITASFLNQIKNMKIFQLTLNKVVERRQCSYRYSIINSHNLNRYLLCRTNGNPMKSIKLKCIEFFFVRIAVNLSVMFCRQYSVTRQSFVKHYRLLHIMSLFHNRTRTGVIQFNGHRDGMNFGQWHD